MERKKLGRTVLKCVAVALIPSLFFGIAALISPIGQRIQTRVYSVEKHYESAATSGNVYAVVDYSCNTSFNPILYPLSWLMGRGCRSGNFSMIYLPDWTTPTTEEGEKYYVPVWGKPKQIENEATMKVILDELVINLPTLFAVFFAIELAAERKLYVWIVGGTAGFIFGSLIGALIGFFSGAFLTVILLPRLRSHTSSRLESGESKAAEA